MLIFITLSTFTTCCKIPVKMMTLKHKFRRIGRIGGEAGVTKFWSLEIK